MVVAVSARELATSSMGFNRDRASNAGHEEL